MTREHKEIRRSMYRKPVAFSTEATPVPRPHASLAGNPISNKPTGWALRRLLLDDPTWLMAVAPVIRKERAWFSSSALRCRLFGQLIPLVAMVVGCLGLLGMVAHEFGLLWPHR